MAYYRNNDATTNKYSDVELGPFQDADSVTVLVSGNPASLQFWTGTQGEGHWTDEREFVAPAGAGTTNSLKISNVRGIRAKSAIAGQPAVVSFALYRSGGVWDSDDPIFEAGSLSPGTISAGGTIVTGAEMITGLVEGTGVILSGTGFTVVRNSAGNYTVTFPPGTFASPPTVVVSEANVAALFATVGGAPLAGSFNVTVWTLAGANADGRFSFIVTPTI